MSDGCLFGTNFSKDGCFCQTDRGRAKPYNLSERRPARGSVWIFAEINEGGYFEIKKKAKTCEFKVIVLTNI